MEISFNPKLASIVGPPPQAPSRLAPLSKSKETVDLSRADALAEALAATPEVRPDVVARGKELASDATYPPEETIRRIALFLFASLEKKNPTDVPD